MVVMSRSAVFEVSGPNLRFIFMFSFNVNIHSHKAQIIGTAVVASLATATLLTTYNNYNKKKRRLHLEEDIKQSLLASDVDASPSPPTVHSTIASGTRSREEYEYDEGLIREQLARNYAFYGEDGMARVRGSYVVIVGAGGVGSWAAMMLARSYVYIFLVFSLFLTIR